MFPVLGAFKWNVTLLSSFVHSSQSFYSFLLVLSLCFFYIKVIIVWNIGQHMMTRFLTSRKAACQFWNWPKLLKLMVIKDIIGYDGYEGLTMWGDVVYRSICNTLLVFTDRGKSQQKITWKHKQKKHGTWMSWKTV